jgi:formylglycine-generating enzyme required for sulfatase activity
MVPVVLLPSGCGRNPVGGSELQRPIVMKDIPAGTFTMGSDSTIALQPHQVTLSAFKMQETEVTQEQYLAVMGMNPSWFNTGTEALHRPVDQVSWYDAAKFCNALSLLSGLSAVYDTVTWTADLSKNGYRLPTEAQWEYACRAGSTTEYWWGADTNGIGARAWSYYNSDATTHPVATRLANAWGLYDMTGNVWEWCNDWGGGSSLVGAETDPTGPASGTLRVLRGGSWYNYGPWDSTINNYYRSAYHNANYPDDDHDNLYGFRCVLPR